jgi:HEAT repeat protein
MTHRSKGRTIRGAIPAPDSVPTLALSPRREPALGTQPGARGTGDGEDPGAFVGQVLCGYRIRRKLAEGGMGMVFEGEHSKLGRRGAIKVLKPEFCRSEDVIERFYQEARAVNSIRHENIVDVYDFGRDPCGRVFFVMEYLEGEPLSARIHRGALPWSEAFPIIEQTLRALKAAHDKGFVHRDLKPENIWLRYFEGRVQVKLLDFGIAKLVGIESPRGRLTKTGAAIGTPHYMSPEQINGERDIDQRTDIYSMGVIVYEMFAGVTPFTGATLQSIIAGHLLKEPPRLTDVPADLNVPASIAEVIDRMLVKDPAARYESTADVLADLRDVSEGRRPMRAAALDRERPARTQTPTAHTAGRLRSRWWRAAVMGGALVALAAAAAIGWKLAMKPHRRPESPVSVDYEVIRRDARATLHHSLRTSEPAVRRRGSAELGKLKDEAAVPALTTLAGSDPDAGVRGHAANALGLIGASSAAQLLGTLEASAAAPLKVWYALALARLGAPGARGRLLEYVGHPELAISFAAGLALADVSRPGDPQVLAALEALAARGSQLAGLAPNARTLILTKLAVLRAPSARDRLYELLESRDKGTRLAAAEGLVKLGDDTGKNVLQDAAADEASPNWIVAKAMLISLGEYRDADRSLDRIVEKLDPRHPETLQLAARALGDIGEPRCLPKLLALMDDESWTVRVAAASAILAIVRLDPQVLARTSVDWAKRLLDSQDEAVRRSALGVLAHLPEHEALPLLKKTLADPDPKVRIAASESAGAMKSPEAAALVAAAAQMETDPKVKAQHVRALRKSSSPVASEALDQLAREPGSVGVLAAGARIAAGDASGVARLAEAVTAPADELRLAAAQAAASVKDPRVVPTLRTGLVDRVPEIRLTAAEGLAAFDDQRAAVLPVLRAALASEDAVLRCRALVVLIMLGEKVPDLAPMLAKLLDSADPEPRRAVVQVVLVLPPGEVVPLLRRLIADPDPEVRRASIDVVAVVAIVDRSRRSSSTSSSSTMPIRSCARRRRRSSRSWSRRCRPPSSEPRGRAGT